MLYQMHCYLHITMLAVFWEELFASFTTVTTGKTDWPVLCITLYLPLSSSDVVHPVGAPNEAPLDNIWKLAKSFRVAENGFKYLPSAWACDILLFAVVCAAFAVLFAVFAVLFAVLAVDCAALAVVAALEIAES